MKSESFSLRKEQISRIKLKKLLHFIIRCAILSRFIALLIIALLIISSIISRVPIEMMAILIPLHFIFFVVRLSFIPNASLLFIY
jgi:hypothetical protein